MEIGESLEQSSRIDISLPIFMVDLLFAMKNRNEIVYLIAAHFLSE